MRCHHPLSVLLILAVLAAPAALADVRLPALVGNNMCLQQGESLKIWGWADPQEKVNVSFNGQNVSSVADAAGNWCVKLPPLKCGGPFDMTIAGKNTITLSNVVIGEVWVCSGQSNMAWSMAAVKNAAEEIAAANFPNIRLFQVPRVTAQQPVNDVKSQWNVCSPQTVPGFSAVAYMFGRNLHQSLQVPIGLIDTSWGGTPAEAWTTAPSIKADPDYKQQLANWDKTIANHPAAMEQHKLTVEKWKQDCTAAKAAGKPLPPAPRAPQGADSPNRPANLYNGMIAPLTNYAIAGAIWYQGESNAGRAYQYRKLLPLMISDWRSAWGKDFPFYIVQLANYMARKWEPAESAWAELREAQSMTAALPNNGQAVIIDVGEATDIHPRDKQTVGYRLALLALVNPYGQEDIEYSGPQASALRIEGNKARVMFTHAEGMAPKGGKFLTGFQIAGADRKWYNASAKVAGDSVLVHSRKVPCPVAVRYAWADNPRANLYNAAGLPASPFRTDDWPGITANNR